MGSVNPVFVTSGALDERLDEFAKGFVASMTLGGGQFCTKPGLLIVPAERSEALRERLKSLLELTKPTPMLSGRVRDGLTEEVARTLETPGVGEIVRVASEDGSGFTTDVVLAVTDGPSYLASPALAEEHFGAFALMVTYASTVARTAIAMALPGSLTATIHCQSDEVDDVRRLASILQRQAGRLIWNGFPTGVAVTDAMEHGGPYPATTFPEHTSVGAFAIRRWLRPVCFQSCPDALLPAALQRANPLHLRRLVNAEWTTAEA
jgi:NADP-dependent aldehyde dehydrogenase